MNKHWKALIAVVLLAIVAGGAYWMQAGSSSSLSGSGAVSGQGGAAAPPKPAANPSGEFPMPVEATKVTIEPARRSTTAVGSFRSFESIIVRPEIAGRVVAFDFKEGEKVTAGQVLVRLDDTLEKATLAQAQSQVDLAKANFDRAQTLLARNVGTGKALDEARAQLQSSTAAVDLAQARLEKMTLIAPFAGTIGLRKVSIGDYLAPGAEIVNLEQTDPLKIDFRVPELFLPAIKIGAPINVQVDAYPGRTFVGEIYAINPLVDEAGRSVVMRARISNADGALRPGVFARIDVTLAVRERSMFVPEQSIVPVGTDTFVFKIAGDRVAMTKVTLGLRRNAQVEVLEGLSDGDMVVTGGLLKIRDGALVSVVPSVTSTNIAPRTGGQQPPPAPATKAQ